MPAGRGSPLLFREGTCGSHAVSPDGICPGGGGAPAGRLSQQIRSPGSASPRGPPRRRKEVAGSPCKEAFSGLRLNTRAPGGPELHMRGEKRGLGARRLPSVPPPPPSPTRGRHLPQLCRPWREARGAQHFVCGEGEWNREARRRWPSGASLHTLPPARCGRVPPPQPGCPTTPLTVPIDRAPVSPCSSGPPGGGALPTR